MNRVPVAAVGVVLCLSGLLGASSSSATWAQRCADDKHVCIDIAVSSVANTITLQDPAVLKMNPPTKFIWKLPEGYVFCYKGSGSTLGGIDVQAHGEVSEKGCVDDDENDTQVVGKRYKLKAKKLLQSSYKYSVIFDEMNGGKPTRRFTCDPRIANSDSTPARKRKPKPDRQPETNSYAAGGKSLPKPDSVPTTFPCTVTASP